MSKEYADTEHSRSSMTQALALKGRLLRLGIDCEHPHCHTRAVVIIGRAASGHGRALCREHGDAAHVDRRIERQREARAAMRSR